MIDPDRGNDSPAGSPSGADGPPTIRIDKWLFFCRAIKSRSLAAKLVGAGEVRVNSEKAGSAAKSIKPGDVVSFMRGHDQMVFRVVSCGTRRGPAMEAQTLYEDLSPPRTARPVSALDRLGPVRAKGSGRPTKRERRQMDELRTDRNPVDNFRGDDHPDE